MDRTALDRSDERFVSARELVAAYTARRSAMLTVARATVGVDEAPDVVQDVLLRIWRTPETVDLQRGSLEQYLIVLTRGVAIDHLRSATRRSSREAFVHRRTSSDATDELATTVVREFVIARIQSAVNDLDPSSRELIDAAFYEDVSYRNIAAACGLPEGTLKLRMRRVLHELRHELRDLQLDEGTSSSSQPMLGS